MCKYIHHSYGGYCGPGFIYIATDGEFYKIGMTKAVGASNHVYKSAGVLAQVRGRIASLRRNSGRNFQIVRVIYTPLCVRGLEHYLHLLCEPYRVDKREWFTLDEAMLEYLLALDTFDGHPLIQIGATYD